uniref:Uncharacterized protein n=1 Tax=Kryptolebias marmoratus TaxID=37003 RepID=A0A3Q3AL98_KRYMA
MFCCPASLLFLFFYSKINFSFPSTEMSPHQWRRIHFLGGGATGVFRHLINFTCIGSSSNINKN